MKVPGAIGRGGPRAEPESPFLRRLLRDRVLALALTLASTAAPSSGCVFLDLRDELSRTQKGLERTNQQLQAAGAQISEATNTLAKGAVPAMNSTASAIRDTKLSLDGAAGLAEPMREMRTEMQAMRADLVALKGQLAETAAMVPALRQVGALREPMNQVAGLRETMDHVAELREPMTNLQGLKQPMQSVAELREPMTATAQLVEPMRTLAGQSRNLESTGQQVGRTLLFYGAILLLLWTLATAVGVWLGVRFARPLAKAPGAEATD